MFYKTSIIGILAAACLTASAGAVLAQDESTNRVAADTDWSVFVEDDPTQCWVVSQPTGSVNTRDGNEVQVNRGDILMFVSFWPGQSRMGEVSFTGGYPYPDGHVVTVEIGSDTFEFYTENRDVDGERVGFAWSASAEEDARLIEAMKRGTDAVVTGVSARGTTTRDTISLLGFTAAVEDAQARCGG
ncbi:invasion associated locus B family protein [Roseibacterium sp. SDUM158016]|uniref:invasion associated locus B family protein n=1 Tax=Roseicyclus sediminis TaxID=2980997 RepID=UPI0021CE85AE|nr:invasion associated locus B family protein [Roseibacterium sp. SDUM158016]MCU4652218.1 invasion associated locus B family protein [Roseibacterium sp. SDUM158016]